MRGLFVSGGGITGALATFRDINPGKDFVAVGYELFETTRAALIDGTLTVAISHAIEDLARETIQSLISAKRNKPEAGAQTVNLDFLIHTSENT